MTAEKDPLPKTGRAFARWLWEEWIKPLIIILAILAPVRSAIADWNDVPTGSMKPTILEGDRVFVNKLAYDLKVPFTTIHIATWDDPDRGDIVVLFSPADGKRLVKRVVGLPGDRIEMRNNVIYVNGSPAGYEALDQAVVDQIGGLERDESVFALEILGEHAHPVMATPGTASIRSFPPINIPGNQYFVMGDNRDNSFDSRFFGFVERRLIIGEAVGVAFSLNHDRFYLPRSDRFLQGLD